MVRPRNISLIDCFEIANRKGGLCLSKNYVKSSSKLNWCCNKGHIWDATYNQIQSGKWCPFCAGKNKTINDCQLIAELHGGKCLSVQYLGVKYKYTWICKYGHIWNATMDKIKNAKQWCPYCAGNVSKNLEDCHRIAEIKGGRFLSNKYILSSTKYRWECQKFHKWKASYNDIQQGRWCPECSDKTQGEKLTRYCFEKMLLCDFKKIRLDWMRNPETGKKLELDGFNQQLGVAFEHQGEQHEKDCRKSMKFYNPKILIRDEIKREKCKERRIILIEVPEIGRRLKVKDLVPFILSEFDKHNIAYPESAKSFQIDMKEFYAEYMNEKSTINIDDLLKEMDAIDFWDESLFDREVVNELENLDFDNPDLFS